MPNLSIKDVPEPLAEALRQRASRHHRSLQGELMAIIEAAVSQPTHYESVRDATRIVRGQPIRRGWKTTDQIAAELAARGPTFPTGLPTGTEIIRQERDSR
jgi:plasmid stability protein